MGGGAVKPAGVKKENQRQSHSFWKEVAEKGGVAFIFFPSPWRFPWNSATKLTGSAGEETAYILGVTPTHLLSLLLEAPFGAKRSLSRKQCTCWGPQRILMPAAMKARKRRGKKSAAKGSLLNPYRREGVAILPPSEDPFAQDSPA